MSARHSPRKRVYEFEYSKRPDPKQVATSLLMGVDILLVDPLLYPSLLQPLDYYRKRYEETKQDKMVEKIDWLVDYINKYPERQMIAAKLSQGPRQPKVKPPPFSREQLDEEVNRILNNESNYKYEPDEFAQLIAEFKKRRKELIEVQDFTEADIHADRLRTLINISESSQAYQFSLGRCKELKEKVDEAEYSLDDIKVRWERVLQAFQQERTKQLENLKQEQAKEYQEFEEKLETTYPKTLPKYTQSHLDLKKKEEQLVLAKKYEDAQQIKNELECYEDAELDNLQEQWQQSNKLQLDTLLRKQRQLYQVRVDYFEQEEKNMNKAMKQEIHAAEHKLETLKTMLIKAQMSANPTQITTSSLPNIKTIRQIEPKEAAFRQRALMNIKIYSRSPRTSPRASPRASPRRSPRK